MDLTSLKEEELYDLGNQVEDILKAIREEKREKEKELEKTTFMPTYPKYKRMNGVYELVDPGIHRNHSYNYRCNLCGVWYATKKGLQKHNTKKCTDIPFRFTCDKCYRSFKIRKNYNEHIESFCTE